MDLDLGGAGAGIEAAIAMKILRRYVSQPFLITEIVVGFEP